MEKSTEEMLWEKEWGLIKPVDLSDEITRIVEVYAHTAWSNGRRELRELRELREVGVAP